MYCPCGDKLCECTGFCHCDPRSCTKCDACRQLMDAVESFFHPGYLIGHYARESPNKSAKSISERSQNEASEYLPAMSSSSSKELQQSSQSTMEPKQPPQISRSTVQVSSTANYKTASLSKCVNPDGSIKITTTPTEFACWSPATALESIQSPSLAILASSKVESDNSPSREPQLAELSLTQSSDSDSKLEVIPEDEDAGQIPVPFIGDPSGVITLNNPSSSCEKPLCKKSDSKEHLSIVSFSQENISVHSSSPENISLHKQFFTRTFVVRLLLSLVLAGCLSNYAFLKNI